MLAAKIIKIKIKNLSRIQVASTLAKRCYSLNVKLDKDVHDKLEKEEIKPRKHIGINKLEPVELPTKIQNAMKNVIGNHAIKTLIERGAVLDRYLHGRKAPTEKHNMKIKLQEFAEIVDSNPTKYNLPPTPPDPSNEIAKKFYEESRKQKIEGLVRQRVYTWQPIVYDNHQCLLYLFGRAPQEYAAIIKIFKEIIKRDPNFNPRSYFDFGSGVGTGIWAASELWKNSIYEYYLVDSSKDMIDLSELILRQGTENKAMSLKNVNFRQFLPGGGGEKFDIVLSAYSMFEQSSLKTRLEMANNLWNKVNDSGYLILIENGTLAGFNMLNEIRDFLIKMASKYEEDFFIFSPCPHKSECPRVELQDGTPCNFEVKYKSLQFAGSRSQQFKSHLYSYFVFKKDKPNDTSDQWPRVVRPTLVRCRHAICRMCFNNGKLDNATFTKTKHEKFAFRCAKHIEWGDQYPSNEIEVFSKNKKECLELDEGVDDSDSDGEKSKEK